MSRSACRPLWEREDLRRAAGDTLRPGGLELTEHALALAGVRPGSRVLDVGCGLGATVRHLAGLGYRAVGLDASAAQISRGRQAAGSGLPLAVADADWLPVRPCSLDAVLCECVLSLLEDPARAMAALGRLLVPGGMLVITDLCRLEGPRTGPRGAGCAHGALNLENVRRMALEAGLTPMALERHDKKLKELAARLILAGVPDHALRPGNGTACAAPRLGYFLLTARRTGGAS